MRLLLFITCLATTLYASDPDPYYGKNSYEATLRFDHRVVFDSETFPTDAEVRDEIVSQVRHLFGPLGVSSRRAVPKNDETISSIRLRQDPSEPGRYIASYRYRGKVLIEGPLSGEYDVYLPISPDDVYDSGIVEKDGRETYPCTDSHYSGRADFWYFWNPRKAGCPLEEGTDYERIKARVDVFFDTQKSYPEYTRLVSTPREIRIDVLVGMDDPAKGRDPIDSRDLNAPTYRKIREALLGLGYQSRRWSAEEIAGVMGSAQGTAPYVEELTTQRKRARVVVRMFFGPTGMEEESRAFHYFYRDALMRSAVMIYDGHSGLSEYLDLAAMEEKEGFGIELPRDRYQIYFFNSCSSYPYYNDLYFGRKRSESDPKGTKNLDILTAGLTTPFSVQHETNMVLIRAIDAWADARETMSYQTIVNRIESGNLVGVNGDEDNPEDPDHA